MKLRALVASFVVIASLVAVAIAGPVPKGLWKPLLTKGEKFSIPAIDGSRDDAPKWMNLEVLDVRTVGGAQVVKLDWSLDGPQTDESYLPTLIAIGKKGVYILDPAADDKAIAKALKKKPTFAEGGKPIKAYSRKDGAFLQMLPERSQPTACYGFGADDPSCGAAPCYSWICLNEAGVVAVGGVGDGYEFGFHPQFKF